VSRRSYGGGVFRAYRLLRRMGFMRRIKGGSVLDLIERFVKAQVTSELGTWTPDQGTPQGAVLSPLLANLYLEVLSLLDLIVGAVDAFYQASLQPIRMANVTPAHAGAHESRVANPQIQSQSQAKSTSQTESNPGITIC
jgi:hypothetical protein